MEHKIEKSLLLTWILALCGMPLFAQVHPRVLFLGNSYTQVNDLPGMVAHIAQSMGDGLTYATNTPGGCTFEMHCSNASMDKICQGGWDYVVLQEQSQLPAFPIEQVEEMVFPFAAQLVDSVYAFNPEGEAMFYMTWGRKNGDTEFGPIYPLMSTYEGMDSLLYERYMYMAEVNDASVCPVGRVWHYLRDHNSEIELYMSDESHPSLAGSYAAACAFYTMLFGRDPDSIIYDAGLGMKTASLIRSATHNVVYDSLWKWQRPEPNVLHDERQRSEIAMSPNPTSGLLTIVVETATPIEVFDIQGRRRLRHQLDAGVNSIDLGNLPEGLYFIKEIVSGTVRKVLVSFD